MSAAPLLVHPDLEEAARFLATVRNVSHYHQKAIAEITQAHIDHALTSAASNDASIKPPLSRAERALEAEINARLLRSLRHLRGVP